MQQQLDHLPEAVKSYLLFCASLYKLDGSSSKQARQLLHVVQNIVETTQTSEALDALELAKLLYQQRVTQVESRFIRKDNAPHVGIEPEKARQLAINSLDEVLHVPHVITLKALRHLETVNLSGGNGPPGNFFGHYAILAAEQNRSLDRGSTPVPETLPDSDRDYSTNGSPKNAVDDPYIDDTAINAEKQTNCSEEQLKRLSKLLDASKLWKHASYGALEALEWLQTSSFLEVNSKSGEEEWYHFSFWLQNPELMNGFEGVVRIAAFLNQQKKRNNHLPSRLALQTVVEVASMSMNDNPRWECFGRLVTQFQTQAEENKKSPNRPDTRFITVADQILSGVGEAFTDPIKHRLQQLEESADQALAFSADVSVYDCLYMFKLFLEYPRKDLPGDLRLFDRSNLKIPYLIGSLFKISRGADLTSLVERLSKLPSIWKEKTPDEEYKIWVDKILFMCRRLPEDSWNKAQNFFEIWCNQNNLIEQPKDALLVLKFGLGESSNAFIAQNERRRDLFKRAAEDLVRDNTLEERLNLQLMLNQIKETDDVDFGTKLEVMVTHINQCVSKHAELSADLSAEITAHLSANLSGKIAPRLFDELSAELNYVRDRQRPLVPITLTALHSYMENITPLISKPLKSKPLKPKPLKPKELKSRELK